MTYESPTLTVLGTVAELTEQIVKQIGTDDGLVLIVGEDITIGSVVTPN